MPASNLKTYFLFCEGIEVHLAHCAEVSPDWDSFINAAVNRRYTRSRIQRTCLQLLCQIHWDEIRSLPPLDTLRPLAFNETGRRYLKQLRASEVRIASRFAAVAEPYLPTTGISYNPSVCFPNGGTSAAGLVKKRNRRTDFTLIKDNGSRKLRHGLQFFLYFKQVILPIIDPF